LPYWRNELGARNVRPATVKNQTKVLRKLASFLGDAPLDSATSKELSAWRDYMYQTERLKPSSVNRYLLTVGTFYNWLAAEGVIRESPVRAVRLIRDRDTTAPQVLQPDALQRIAKGAGTITRGRSTFESVRDQAIVSLLQDSGLRASECAGLLVEHVDLSARQAFVHADVAKGGYPRTVTFGFPTAKLLNR
jgi:site-specific recombinase XerD